MARFADPVAAINYLAESNLARPRNPRKMTYRDLAARSGLNESTIWRIVNGRSVASPLVKETLQRLANEAWRAKRREKKRNGQ